MWLRTEASLIAGPAAAGPLTRTRPAHADDTRSSAKTSAEVEMEMGERCVTVQEVYDSAVRAGLFAGCGENTGNRSVTP
jgi:hypothetical protein